ncbi:MAG: hypothetical protein RDU14_16635 [Melioribacteraceae bacterium]|nr:hypothetical protein [Melioribacteraceae bacterium]
MVNHAEILVAHFKVVGDTLIKLNQEYLEELLKLNHAETRSTQTEQTLRVSIKQIHYLLVRQYVVESVNTMFN